jgi:hypothetical protein
MKKLFFFACLILFTSVLTALGQSTTILPGILLPQMTTAQRTAIASPQNGMLVFDTNTQSYWFRQSGTWVNLSAGGSSYWQLNGAGGNEIKNTNTGGFWSANPTGLTVNSTDITNPPTAPVSGAGTRLMWIPSRSAFRAGTVEATGSSYWDAANIGLFSFATGHNTRASGQYSTAMGLNTTASGEYSTAMGYFTTANKLASTAMGSYTTASGQNSTAMGYSTTASEIASTAMGYQTTASKFGSTATGANTIASGKYSTAMGDNTTASDEYSTAMGANTTASGFASTAMGYTTAASGEVSTSMGTQTTASGDYSTAMGYYTTASGEVSTSMGDNTIASGEVSTAMGYRTIASSYASTAMGAYNVNNPNAIFMVGNGTSGNRLNAFTIRRDNNYVGIGTDNPIAHLHVGSFGLINTGALRYFETTAPGFINQNPSAANTSIYANFAIISGTLVGAAQNVTASDARIKNIMGRSDNVADLELLKKIQITNYRMKDQGTWGKQIFKKVIAQEVEKIYPEAVRQQTSIIPDIYALADKVTYDANKKELTVSLSKSYDLKVGDNIELVHPEKGKTRSTISAVLGNAFTVKDWLYETDKIFVFGREVNDFRVIDYEALSMLSISAIQQLAKENAELRAKSDELRAKSDELKAKSENTEARLEKLESLVNQLSSVEANNKTSNK